MAIRKDLGLAMVHNYSNRHMEYKVVPAMRLQGIIPLPVYRMYEVSIMFQQVQPLLLSLLSSSTVSCGNEVFL